MTIPRNLSFLAAGASSTGVLGVSNGGSGATTLSGYLFGNGTSAFTASATIPTSALSGTVSLTSQVSGILPIANGGTAQSSFTAGYIHFGSFSTSSNLVFDSTNFCLGINNGTPFAYGSKLVVGNYSDTSATLNGAYFASNKAILNLWADGNTNANGATISVGWANGGQGPLKLAIGASEAMRIHASGGVSIGNTTDPGAGGLRITGSFINSGTPSSTYHLDTTPNIATYTTGTTVNFSNFSGMLLVNATSTGDVSCYIAGGGIVTRLGSTTGAVGTVTYNAGINGITWTNTTVGSVAAGFAIVRTRTGQ
jgi:hypothetical protein